MQTSIATTSVDAFKEFSATAERLSVTLATVVQFSQITGSPGNWRTHFMYMPPDAQLGVPKGGRDGSETPEQTARREFTEESGLSLPPTAALVRLQARGDYRFFQYEAPPLLRKRLEKQAADNQTNHYSELYYLAFRPLEGLLSSDELNSKSREALVNLKRLTPA